MFSDIVTQKADAKKDIRSALLGLLIVLGAVLILTVINPDLTNFDVSVERQEVRDVPPAIPVETFADLCASSSDCTEETTESGDVTTVVVDTEDIADRPRAIAQAMQACETDGGVGILQRNQVYGENTTYEVICSAASTDGQVRLQTVIASGSTLPPDVTVEDIIDDRFVDLYERFIMPFEVTDNYESDPGILFAVDVGSDGAEFTVINELCDSTETTPGLIWGTWAGGVLEGTGAVLERNEPPDPWVCRIPS